MKKEPIPTAPYHGSKGSRPDDRDHHLGATNAIDIVFADKRMNSTGLQLADLVRQPVGRHILNPELFKMSQNRMSQSSPSCARATVRPVSMIK